MNQLLPTITIKQNQTLNKEKIMPYSFALNGYDKIADIFSLIKKLIKRTSQKNILHDFYNVFTAEAK